MKEKIEKIYDILRKEFSLPAKEKLSPAEELVLTVLSQNTSDRNRDLAWKRLRERFPKMEDLEEASVEEIEEAIKPAGLYRQKARSIKQVLRKLREEFGSLNIPLKGEEAYRFLLSLKGVGPKTAAVVSLFSLGHPYFPVDTHIFRVSNRIPLVRGKTREKVQEELNKKVPDEIKREFHLLLIELGRKYCRPKPRCKECPLKGLCSYSSRFLKPDQKEV